MDLMTSDNYAAYETAILQAYGQEVATTPSGRPSRRLVPAKVPPPGLNYATVEKRREKGRVVEIVSGMNLDQFFKQRIFAPIGMNNTFFATPPNRISDVAEVYRQVNGTLTKANPPAAAAPGVAFFSGAGGLTGTAEDYLQFCQMLLNGGQLNGVRLLSRKSVEMMSDNAIGDLLPLGSQNPCGAFGSGGFLSNIDNAYVYAFTSRGFGPLVVFHGRAPTFANTYPHAAVMPGGVQGQGRGRAWGL